MRRQWALPAIWSLAFATMGPPAAHAQFGRNGAEWMTSGSDAQRTFSIPNDAKISPQSLEKGGFEFLWKVKLNNEPVQLNSLMPAILMDRYIGYRGFRSFAFVAGSSNSVAAVDTDLARIEWQVRLAGAAPSAGSLGCPGGVTTAVARSTTADYPSHASGGGGLGGRSAPAKSGVGDPGEGAVTIAPALAAQAAAAASPGRGRGSFRLPAEIYVVGADGALHAMNISNGHEPEAPVNFVTANSGAQALTVIDGVAYVATPGCGGTPSGVSALEIASKQVKHWRPSSGAIAGSAGPAFGPDGTVYVTTTAGSLVALEPKTLNVMNTSSTAEVQFSSSPVVFGFHGRDLVAAAAKDGKIHVFDMAGAALTSSQAFSSNFAPTALSTFQSANGTRWILAPVPSAPAAGSGFPITNGAITDGAMAAWKLSEAGGALSVQPAWISRDLVSPMTPMILNGVVFALSSGEYRTSDAKMTAAQRAQKSSPAVLYALDIANGKSLWDSGKTISSFVHSGGLSGGAGQLYVETYDQTVYAFGYPIEH